MKESRHGFIANKVGALLMAALIVTFGLIISPPGTVAQSATATLSGTVVDPNGQIVPGVTVTIANPTTGFARETTTNDDGVYTFLNLAPDTYMLTARRQGFATAENKDVVLNVNDKRSLRIQLRVGEIAEVVQVTGEASLVDQSPAVGTVVDRTFFENLPLNGRSFQPLIALSPGVVITGTSSADQGQFSVNGQRTASNSFYVDGVSANFGGIAIGDLGQFAGGALPALSAQGSTSALVSVDAVQEVAIQTSTYAPEFGRTPGAQISILTRAGTNRFNGSIFEYFRNEKLDANDFFANRNGQARAPLRLNNFGGVLGGPVYLPRFGEGEPPLWSGKDRTFFFFSYERQLLRLPQTRTYQVPSLAARLAAPPVIQPFINAYPLPNGPVNATNPLAATFNTTFSDPSDLTSYGLRLDHNFNSRLQIFGRYNYSPSNRGQRGVGQLSPNGILDTVTKVRMTTVGAIWSINSNMTNDFRANYSTNNVQSVQTLDNFGGAVPFNSSAFFTTPRPFTESDSFFQIQAFGFPTIGLGTNADNKQRQLNLVNHLSLIKGSHTLKFGADYRRLSPSFGPRNVSVNALFNSPADLIANNFTLVFFEAGQAGSLILNNFGLYAQDTWRAMPRLTLTYGLRWDVDFAPKAAGELQPVAVTSAGFDDPTKIALAPQGTPLFETSYNNIAPRIGLAYQLRQQQGWETVLRGGFGMFYDLASQGIGQQVRLGQPPFGNTAQLLNPSLCALFGLPPSFCTGAFPITPGIVPPAVGSVILPLQNPTFFNPQLKQPYTFQWNASVEQSLGAGQTFSASYVAAASRRLLREKLVTGSLLPPGGVFGVTPPDFFNPSLVDNGAISNYRSLQLQFQRRLSSGFQALASYTFGKSEDTASSGQVSVSDARLNIIDDVDLGSSSFDIRHTFNAGISYEIPAPFGNRALRAILGGWALDNIFTSRSAPPLDVFVSDNFTVPPGNVIGLSGLRPDLVPDVPVYLFGDQYPGGKALNRAAFRRPPVNAAGFPTRQGTLQRNSLRGFGQWQLDTSVRRQFSFSERTKLQLRADFFNIFNHPNFGGVNTAFSSTFASPTFGQATSMLGRSLGQGGTSGGFNPLFQIGGPRSTQLSVKILF